MAGPSRIGLDVNDALIAAEYERKRSQRFWLIAIACLLAFSCALCTALDTESVASNYGEQQK